MEMSSTIAEDDFIVEGLGDVTLKYPAGITDADYSLLKIGGGNCVFKNIVFDLSGVDNANTTLGGVHFYHANAVNSKLVDCVLKSRTGGPAINFEAGSFASLEGVKFESNTVDIKTRIASFNYLNLVNCYFGNPCVIDNDTVVINSVNNKNLGNIGLKSSSDEILLGCYFDGTSYRKIANNNTAWRIRNKTGIGAGIYFQEEDIIAVNNNAIFGFNGDEVGFLITGNIYTPKIMMALQGISYTQTNLIPGDTFKTIVFEIGDWDMDATGTKAIDISSIKGGSSTYAGVVRTVQVMVVADNGNMLDLVSGGGLSSGFPGTPTTPNGAWYIDEASGEIRLWRLSAGEFDSTSYDQTSYNRGFVTITYLYT
jgi:hypothetical protein